MIKYKIWRDIPSSKKEVEFKFHVEIEVINNHILSSTTATSAEERPATRGDTKTIHIFLSCLFSYKEYKYQRNTFYHCPIILKSINIPTHFVSLTSFSRVFTFKKISIKSSDKFIAKLLLNLFYDWLIRRGRNCVSSIGR